MASNFLYTSSNQKSELSIPDTIITLFPYPKNAKKKKTNIFPSITKIYHSSTEPKTEHKTEHKTEPKTEHKTEHKNIFSPSSARRELK